MNLGMSTEEHFILSSNFSKCESVSTLMFLKLSMRKINKITNESSWATILYYCSKIIPSPEGEGEMSESKWDKTTYLITPFYTWFLFFIAKLFHSSYERQYKKPLRAQTLKLDYLIQFSALPLLSQLNSLYPSFFTWKLRIELIFYKALITMPWHIVSTI